MSGTETYVLDKLQILTHLGENQAKNKTKQKHPKTHIKPQEQSLVSTTAL